LETRNLKGLIISTTPFNVEPNRFSLPLATSVSILLPPFRENPPE
jgi:hypothetical protein